LAEGHQKGKEHDNGQKRAAGVIGAVEGEARRGTTAMGIKERIRDEVRGADPFGGRG